MRWLVEVTIGAMLDARSRRAIEETLLDWSHEAQLARGLLSRVLCHARAILAIARTLASIVLHEVAELPKSGVWIRVGLWLIVSFALYQTASSFQLPARATPAAKLVTSLMLFPSWIVLFGPVALFLGTMWQPRADQPRTPFLGLAVLAVIGAFVLAGWVAPIGNQEFREIVFEMHGGQGSLPRGAAELTVPDLLSVYWFWPSLAGELQLHARFALIAACPALVLLAAQLQPMRRRHRWVLAPFFLYVLLSAIEEGVYRGALDKPVSVWVIPVAVFVAAAAIVSWRHAMLSRESPVPR